MRGTNPRAWLIGMVVAVVVALPAAGQGFIKWESADAGLDRTAELRSLACGGDPPVLLAALAGRGLFRSDDAGGKWTRVTGEAPCLATPGCVAVAPGNRQVQFVSVAAPGGGLYRTGDGGQTWAKCAGLASEDVASVTWSAADPRVVFVGHAAGRLLSVSPDGGVTWRQCDLGAALTDQMVFATGPTRWAVVARDQDNAVRITQDAGATWAAAQGDTQHHAGRLLVVQTGEYLFGTRHHGHLKSVDGGQTWAYKMEQHTRMIGTAGPYIFRESNVQVREGNRVWVLQMSADYGGSWPDVTFGIHQAIVATRGALPPVFTNMDPFQGTAQATAWATTPDGRTVFLGLGAAGLYRGRLLWTPKGPLLAAASVAPPAVVEKDVRTKLKVQAVATTRQGRVTKVTADLATVGGGQLPLLDDGQHDDGAAADKTYANSFTVGGQTRAGDKLLGVIAEDDQGRLSSAVLHLTVASTEDKTTIWDGDKYAAGLAWAAPQTPLIFLKAQTEEVHEGKVALEFRAEGSGWVGGGWNWHGWWPPNSGDDLTRFANLSFWLKVQGDNPQGLTVSLNCSATKKPTASANVFDYVGDLVDPLDGQWHEVVIPLKDMYLGAKEFDPRSAWEFGLSSWAPHPRAFSVFIDEIAFDNRPVRAHSELVTPPQERPLPALKTPAAVTAEVDTKGPGTPISPYIYGASMGDRTVGREAGVTIMRAGGNPVTPLNWKKGFGANGSDWYFTNSGAATPPENNWLLTFHRDNRQAGCETYLTIPIMGRVAKDGTSSAFDITKYADQDSWAGKAQPTDPHPNAGSGRQYVKGPDGQFQKDDKGNLVTRLIEPDPNDTSVEMSPDEQCEMLRFMIEKMGYGTADKGGVKYLALDNEPMLWSSTHRGMHPKGTTYDELWERTREYASRLKKIDPTVKIAGPTLWGWTAYFYSGLDSQLVGEGKGNWDAPPDFAAHGQVPLCKWWLLKLKEYEQQHGVRLVDVLDWHFYPQTGIYMGGAANDPQVMEGRVQETRVMWDPEYRDPTWMGKETNKVIKLVRLMKEWVAECNPGMQIALGEYNFGGEKDVSGGVAQAELLGVFAREQVDFAFLWVFPQANSPHYFAFKLFRNPDGQQTAFGDRYLTSKVSAPLDVSVHAAKDSKTGKLTVVLVNKRAAKDALVTIKLGQPVPVQDVVCYEYSRTDRFAIGQRPPLKVAGEQFEVALPALSVVRCDLRP